MNTLNIKEEADTKIKEIIDELDPEKFWCFHKDEYVYTLDCAAKTPAAAVNYKSGRCYDCLRTPNETHG